MLFRLRETERFTLDEAIKGGLIPASYDSTFRKIEFCECCGSPIVINRNKTEMKCSNADCPMTLTARVLGVYTRYDSKGIGPATVYKYLEDNQIKNMYEALIRPPQLIQAQIQEWFNTPHNIGEVLYMLNLPGQGETIKSYFTKVADSKRFIHDIYTLAIGQLMRYNGRTLDAQGMRRLVDLYFQLDFDSFKASFNKLSIDLECETKDEFDFHMFKNGVYWYLTKGIPDGKAETARDLAETLAYYRNEFIHLLSTVKIDTPVSVICKIVITGDILNVTKSDGTYYEREEFVAFLNTFTRPRGQMLVNSSALKSCDYVIADTPSSTNKYKAGKADNKLITSDAFLALVKSGAYPANN